MVERIHTSTRRKRALSRDRIIRASVALLDRGGEGGLTFRALSERLATGPGAIYWHVANKSELLMAACDAIVARATEAPVRGTTPRTTIRALARNMFDAIDTHPWIGSALVRAPGQLPMVRVLECLGEQVRVLGVPDANQWTVVGALLNYILGVGGQNAANRQLALTQGLGRSDFLKTVSGDWLRLDPDQYPFVRSIAGYLRAHDDRADFLAGIDLILAGVDSLPHRQKPENRAVSPVPRPCG